MALEDTSASLTGKKCYEKAIHALEQAKLEKEEREAQRSKEQFTAWQKAQQAQQQRPASKGVAVIKTIARQARQRRNEEEKWMDQARFWMNKAGLEHGHPEALVRLGNDALDKVNASLTKEEDIKKAIEFYQLAGKNGSAEGWFNLGHLLWTGYPSQEEASTEEDKASDEPKTYGCVKPDKKEALKAFFKSIDLGDRDAMVFVGVQLLSDENEDTGIDYSSHTERYQKGLALIEKAASLEHGGALYYLCLLHLNGREELHISPCAPEEFVRRLDVAANAGDSDALFLRGHCFYEGDEGYSLNLKEAFQNFLAAAEAGHSDAAVSAGAMLHQGVGVKSDQRRAFDLYQMAGELGNVEGWRNVVACYALGEGVPQSHEMAQYIAKTVLRDE